MKQHKEFEKYVMSVVKKYSKILLLDSYTVELSYGLKHGDTIMECDSNYPYLGFTINYGDKVIDKWKNKENIVDIIIHELCHPITEPLYIKGLYRYIGKEEIEDEREKLTDYIANIIIKNKL